MRRILVAALVLLLSSCATSGKPKRILQETLINYASAVRWSGFEQALAFMDPEVLKAHPPSKLELERFRQVRVTFYHDQPAQNVSETEVTQIVEIGIVNEHSQSERSVIDRQRWRWDEPAKKWWLVSGLPDITRQQ
jgi:hypothetical protein